MDSLKELVYVQQVKTDVVQGIDVHSCSLLALPYVAPTCLGRVMPAQITILNNAPAGSQVSIA